MKTEKNNAHQLVPAMFKSVLPQRNKDAHKGSCGSVAIVGGDDGMIGAVLLAARAALFSGAGRVYAAMLSKSAFAVDVCHPEIMLRSPLTLAQLSQLDSIVIGPGLGQSIGAVELLVFWLTQPAGQHIPMLLDADALNLVAQHAHLADLVKARHAETVITPHAGEAARLLATNAESIQSNRIDAALQLATTFKVTCVLKGAGTVCAYHNGSYVVNTSGNPALATGGTGDVLSGLIASLVAQGVKPLDAAKLGVYAHGLAADNLLKKGIGPIGLTASEVVLEARNVINQLYEAA